MADQMVRLKGTSKAGLTVPLTAGLTVPLTAGLTVLLTAGLRAT